jgi:hypothetical protein
MRTWLWAALAAVLTGAAYADEPAGKAVLSDAQSRALLETLCEEPVHPATGLFGGEVLTCDRPRGYPMAGDCPLSLRSSAPGQKVPIYYGHFQADESQAVVFYQAACEPHATNWGGMALLRVTPKGAVLIRYDQGLVGEDCAVVPGAGAGRDALYCFAGHVGQGVLEQGFGPLVFAVDGSARWPPWLTAGNIDACWRR